MSDRVPCSQRIRATVDSEERKRMLMDLNVSMMSISCPYTVTFYGALFREVVHTPSHHTHPHSSRPHAGRCVDLYGADGQVPTSTLSTCPQETSLNHPRTGYWEDGFVRKSSHDHQPIRFMQYPLFTGGEGSLLFKVRPQGHAQR